MDHLGVWGWEITRRLLSHHGNVLYSALSVPAAEDMTEESVWCDQRLNSRLISRLIFRLIFVHFDRAKAATLESSNYAPSDVSELQYKWPFFQ